MESNELIEALKYYNISDQNYLKKCEECLSFIKSNSKLLYKFNYYHNILFKEKNQDIRELWQYKKLEDLFKEEVDPFITNVLLLSGYKYHNQNMKSHSFNEDQIIIHKNRVREALTDDIIKRKFNGIRISQMLWGAYFIDCRLIEIGSLQFEYFDNTLVKIHIPKKCEFDINIVKSSIKKSREYIQRYFNISNFDYYCDSWLLSKQIHTLVNKDTNIYKFYELFDVTEGENCIGDILNFVYGKAEVSDYSNLNSNTSLQINIKEYLMKGNEIKIGNGKLKKFA